MASCDHCGTTIVFGGKSANGFRYCNDKCYEQGYLAHNFAAIPQNVFEAELQKVRSAPCSVCGGPGPIDVYTSYKVWSLLHFAAPSSTARICCRKCGRKAQIFSTLFCFVFGWWSIEGVFLTPVQIGLNLKGLLKPPDAQKPSPELQKQVRLKLAAQIKAPAATTTPLPLSPIPQAKATRPAAPSSSSGPFCDIGKPLN
jgi:hypothetical protein